MYLFAAVNPVTGASSALIAPTVNTDYMNEHLRFISEQAGEDKHIVLRLKARDFNHPRERHYTDLD